MNADIYKRLDFGVVAKMYHVSLDKRRFYENGQICIRYVHSRNKTRCLKPR